MKMENYRLIATNGTQYLFESNGEVFLSGMIWERRKPPFTMGGFIAPVDEYKKGDIKDDLQERNSRYSEKEKRAGEAIMKRFFEAGYIVKDLSYVNPCEQICVLEGEGKPVVAPYCNWGGVDRNPRSPEEVIRGEVHLLYR